MHTFSETGTGVPAFLAKLWRLVEDPETNHLIYWNRDGRSFIIQNQAQFARELLPMNYKHNNMASFIRQLNMYGFHKITSIENGGLKFDRDEMEFSHPCFKRGYPYLLEHIKRKIATTKSIDEKSPLKPETVSKVLNEVKVMRGRQDSLDSRFSAMKQENEALWREIAVLRQKHLKQQQIVNKLIQFLVTIVQPSRNMTGVKRNYQLMINDAPQTAKVRKRCDSNSGPIIHELTEELLDEVAYNDDDSMVASPHVMSPGGDGRCDASDAGDEITRPRSTLSIGSLPESNNGDEFLASPSTNLASTSHTPDPDIEPIVYHITELPENADYTDTVTEKVTVRSQNRRGRKRKHTEVDSAEIQNMGTSAKFAQKNKNGISELADTNLLNIKKEKDLDPLSFLADPAEVDQVEVDSELMQALTGENSGNNSSASGSGSCSGSSSGRRNNDKQIYINQNDFISSEMPADLFEDTTAVNDLNTENGAYNEASLNFLKNRTNSNVANQTTTASSSNTGDNSAEEEALKRNLSLTKYNNDEILRFNTPRDITTHLDSVQEDLDSLKDFLRNDGYTFDANTLLSVPAADRIILNPSFDSQTLEKLFGDSDVLGMYGLPVDQQNVDSNKKGNELMAYQQPTYFAGDLTDMLNMDSDALPKDNDYNEKRNGTNSVLNTPMPERD